MNSCWCCFIEQRYMDLSLCRCTRWPNNKCAVFIFVVILALEDTLLHFNVMFVLFERFACCLIQISSYTFTSKLRYFSVLFKTC